MNTERVRGFRATIEIIIPADDPNVARRYVYALLDSAPPDADGSNKVVAEFYGFKEVEIEVDRWGYQVEVHGLNKGAKRGERIK